MAQAHLHESRKRQDEHQQSTDNVADRARDNGLVVVLWLFALLIAEAELFMWVMERGYSR